MDEKDTGRPAQSRSGTVRRRRGDDDDEPTRKRSFPHEAELLIGLVSISDRASSGVYEDKGMPGLQDWFGAALDLAVADGDATHPRRAAVIERTLIELVDDAAATSC